MSNGDSILKLDKTPDEIFLVAEAILESVMNETSKFNIEAAGSVYSHIQSKEGLIKIHAAYNTACNMPEFTLVGLEGSFLGDLEDKIEDLEKVHDRLDLFNGTDQSDPEIRRSKEAFEEEELELREEAMDILSRAIGIFIKIQEANEEAFRTLAEFQDFVIESLEKVAEKSS